MTYGYFMGKLTVMDNLKPSISVLGNSNVCLMIVVIEYVVRSYNTAICYFMKWELFNIWDTVKESW